MSDPKGRVIVFKDHPEFRPNLTPRQVIMMGSFGGTYFRPIHSSVSGKNYRNKHKKYGFFDGIPDSKLTRAWEDYDININKYKVKVGQTLEYWEAAGWITKYDPYGWFMWYCEFYNGRRCADDERQIKRWQGVAGENGRFRRILINKIKKKRGRCNDYNISPKIRQTLQHWAYKLTDDDC